MDDFEKSVATCLKSSQCHTRRRKGMCGLGFFVRSIAGSTYSTWGQLQSNILIKPYLNHYFPSSLSLSLSIIHRDASIPRLCGPMAHSKLPTQLGSTEVVMLVGNTLSPKIQATLNVGERRFCVNVPLQVGLKDQRTKGKTIHWDIDPKLGSMRWGWFWRHSAGTSRRRFRSDARPEKRWNFSCWGHPFTSFHILSIVASCCICSWPFSRGTPNLRRVSDICFHHLPPTFAHSHLVTHVITGSQATLQNSSDSRDLCHPAVILTISYMTTKNIKKSRLVDSCKCRCPLRR